MAVRTNDPVWKLVFRSEEVFRSVYEGTLVHHGLVVPRPRAEELETTVQLHLVLPGERGDAWLTGRVVGVSERPSRPKAPFDIQFELLDVDPELLARLRPGGGALPARPALPPAQPEPRRASSADGDLDAFVDRLLERQRKPRPVPAEEPPEAPPPEPVAAARLPEELAKEVTEFTTQFVRAVTKSSYYTADHQEADKAKLGIYAAFEALVAGRPEVTFYARKLGERFTILVYGVFDEPADLARAMLPGQAELYIPKLAHHFEANGLVSISFKPALGEDEFHPFVDLLASPGGSDGIVERLAARHIHNISVVVAEDRVRSQGLSWRVEMALTRLRKDLSVIPLYQHLSEQQLALVRLQVFRDVLRPLRDVDVIRELLENCDRVVDAVEEFTEVQLAEIEAQVLASVPDALLPPLLEGFAEDIAAAKQAQSGELERLLRLARRVVEQLRPEQAKSLEDAFRKLLEARAVELEDLPPVLCEKITVERDADVFVELQQQILECLDRETRSERYQALLTHFESIFGELLSRRDPAPTLAIVDRVGDHRDGGTAFAERASLAASWFDRLLHGPVAESLTRQLALADNVKREALLHLCGRLKADVAPILVASLSACSVAGARQAIGAALADLKHVSTAPLRQELARRDLPSEALIEFARLIGAVGGADDADALAGALAHGDPRVRLEALATTFRLAPEAGERCALAALADEDGRVRDASLKLLFQHRSAAPELFAFCRRALEGEAADASLLQRVCTGLAAYERGDGRDRAISLLCAALGPAGAERGGLWSSLKRSVRSESGGDEVAIAACRALGRLRAEAAREALESASRSSNASLERAARKALALLGGGEDA